MAEVALLLTGLIVVAFARMSGVMNVAELGILVELSNERQVAFAQDLMASWIGVNIPLLVVMMPKMCVLS